MFGSRRRPPEREDPTDALVREVGAELRDARLARGEKLEQVAENLRIRASYLHGIEQGDLSVVPGRAYALGFLRTYARHLGFDGDELIGRIRSSVTDLAAGAQLHGRAPLAESRLPRLPMLVISLAALAAIYAGWRYVDEQGEPEADPVAEVPTELRPAPLPDITPAIAPADAPVSEPTPAPVIAPAVSAPEPRGGPAGAPAGADLPAAPEADPEPAAAEPLPPEPAPQPYAGTGLVPAATPEPPAGTSAETSARPPPAALEAADALAALEPVTGDAEPAVDPTDETTGRVVLRARSSAWVHVSSTNNDYLWVRTLRPGEAFAVPDRPDLVLWTGNAGGVEVIVDGEALAPLGPEAGVVRDLPLRPEDLLQRLSPMPAAGR